MAEKPTVQWKYPRVFEGYRVVSEKLEFSTPQFSFLVVEVAGEEFEGYFCKNCSRNARINEASNIDRIFCYYCTDDNNKPLQDARPHSVGSFEE